MRDLRAQADGSGGCLQQVDRLAVLLARDRASEAAKSGRVMAVHTLHPSIREHGLADDCLRCAEHAENPVLGLDDGNLLELVYRTIRWMRDEDVARSDTELIAMRNLERHVVYARAMKRLGVSDW